MNDGNLFLDVCFQLGKCVKVVMINLFLHCSPQVKVAGGQVRRSCRPQALAHHTLFTEIPMQVRQCSPGCVGRSTVLLESNTDAHPLSAGHAVFAGIHRS
jgi:hypothetical protein